MGKGKNLGKLVFRFDILNEFAVRENIERMNWVFENQAKKPKTSKANRQVA